MVLFARLVGTDLDLCILVFVCILVLVYYLFISCLYGCLSGFDCKFLGWTRIWM